MNEADELFKDKDEIEKMNLIEIGPWFCLQPIKVFKGFLGGETIYQNPKYITPTRLRSKKYLSFVNRRE